MKECKILLILLAITLAVSSGFTAISKMLEWEQYKARQEELQKQANCRIYAVEDIDLGHRTVTVMELAGNFDRMGEPCTVHILHPNDERDFFTQENRDFVAQGKDDSAWTRFFKDGNERDTFMKEHPEYVANRFLWNSFIYFNGYLQGDTLHVVETRIRINRPGSMRDTRLRSPADLIVSSF